MTGRRLAICFVLLLFGCASGGAERAADASPSLLTGGEQIGSIQITLGGGLAEDQRSVIEQYQAVDRLRSELKLALERRSAFSEQGGLALDVELDGFRLRSNSASVWLGSMAGADFLGVKVGVRRNDTVIKTYGTDTSSIQGGLAMPGRTKRLNHLTVELAKRIVDGI